MHKDQVGGGKPRPYEPEGTTEYVGAGFMPARKLRIITQLGLCG